MFKKRAMSDHRFMSELESMKSFEIGYAGNQPKWPYWIQPLGYSPAEWNKIHDWVVDTMGYRDWLKEDARWVGSDRKYWFRDECDRTMFILRWS